MKYVVQIQEVHSVNVEVELPEGSSLDLIRQEAYQTYTDSEMYNLQYHDTTDSDSWPVFNAQTGKRMYD